APRALVARCHHDNGRCPGKQQPAPPHPRMRAVSGQQGGFRQVAQLQHAHRETCFDQGVANGIRDRLQAGPLTRTAGDDDDIGHATSSLRTHLLRRTVPEQEGASNTEKRDGQRELSPRAESSSSLLGKAGRDLAHSARSRTSLTVRCRPRRMTFVPGRFLEHRQLGQPRSSAAGTARRGDSQQIDVRTLDEQRARCHGADTSTGFLTCQHPSALWNFCAASPPPRKCGSFRPTGTTTHQLLSRRTRHRPPQDARAPPARSPCSRKGSAPPQVPPIAAPKPHGGEEPSLESTTRCSLWLSRPFPLEKQLFATGEADCRLQLHRSVLQHIAISNSREAQKSPFHSSDQRICPIRWSSLTIFRSGASIRTMGLGTTLVRRAHIDLRWVASAACSCYR